MPSKSKSQRRLFGMVAAAQHGKKPASEKIAKMAASIKPSDVDKFAKTKEKNLPEKVKKESLSLKEILKNSINEDLNAEINSAISYVNDTIRDNKNDKKFIYDTIGDLAGLFRNSSDKNKFLNGVKDLLKKYHIKESTISLKSLVKEVVHLINESNLGDNSPEFQKLWDELVPDQGQADTLEGEMLRAIGRIEYRYWNDGDYYFKGYGRETCGATATWLRTKTPISNKIASLLNQARKGALPDNHNDLYTEKDGYAVNLKKIAELITDYVKSKNGNYTKNTQSSR